MSSKNVKAIPSNISEVNNQKSQRALIFQGGGSLGAYEAGVFVVLYHWIKKH
jgi:predicted acylesterase/phospholipase RssA